MSPKNPLRGVSKLLHLGRLGFVLKMEIGGIFHFFPDMVSLVTAISILQEKIGNWPFQENTESRKYWPIFNIIFLRYTLNADILNVFLSYELQPCVYNVHIK